MDIENKTYTDDVVESQPRESVESEKKVGRQKKEKKEKEKLLTPNQASIILGIGGYDRVVLLKKYRGEKKTIKDWKNILKK